jgi:hypothetical protein
MPKLVGVRPLSLDRVTEAVDVLARAMADDPLTRFLAHGPVECDGLRGLLFGRTLEHALAEGRVDAWGDPIVAVAVWLRLQALDDPDVRSAPPAPSPQPDPWLAVLGPDGVERVARLGAA